MTSPLFEEVARIASPQIDPTQLLLNLLVGLALSFVLRWHFVRFGKSAGGRTEFARNFTLIILTIIVMISLIKNSVAISLGLVGALSLVRFRTPIKEPEELVYLLLAVVVGTGLGAGATLGTLIATLLILLLTAFSSKMGFRTDQVVKVGGMHISVSHEGERLPTLTAVLGAVRRVIAEAHLERFDLMDRRVDVIMYVPTTEAQTLAELAQVLADEFPGVNVSAVEAQSFTSGS
jgi:hypothetical protein